VIDAQRLSGNDELEMVPHHALTFVFVLLAIVAEDRSVNASSMIRFCWMALRTPLPVAGAPLAGRATTCKASVAGAPGTLCICRDM
jgi:hypothetical protein